MLARQAERWAEYVLARGGLAEAEVWRRALRAVRFSAEVGTHNLAVPAELLSTFRHQEALERLQNSTLQTRKQTGFKPGFQLAVEENATADAGEEQGAPDVRLQIRHGEDVLGYVPAKDESWLRPLLAQGASVHLLGVRISPPGVTRTCRVVFTQVASALSQLNSPEGY